MSGSVTLLGTESLDRAGRNIVCAAEQIERNVAWFTEALERDRLARAEQDDLVHARGIELLDRFEALVKRLEEAIG
jgi:hypothetical protein